MPKNFQPERSLYRGTSPRRGLPVSSLATSAEVPTRLVASAKSWLSHTGVDRTSALLPWNAPPDVARISPVEASARYLRHLAAAWNHAHRGSRLDEQEIVLTVPASFDAAARELTMQAARSRPLQCDCSRNPRLRQAWLELAGDRFRKQVRVVT
jgi:molecular chaperone DnaK (HSP70)